MMLGSRVTTPDSRALSETALGYVNSPVTAPAPSLINIPFSLRSAPTLDLTDPVTAALAAKDAEKKKAEKLRSNPPAALPPKNVTKIINALQQFRSGIASAESDVGFRLWRLRGAAQPYLAYCLFAPFFSHMHSSDHARRRLNIINGAVGQLISVEGDLRGAYWRSMAAESQLRLTTALAGYPSLDALSLPESSASDSGDEAAPPTADNSVGEDIALPAADVSTPAVGNAPPPQAERADANNPRENEGASASHAYQSDGTPFWQNGLPTDKVQDYFIVRQAARDMVLIRARDRICDRLDALLATPVTPASQDRRQLALYRVSAVLGQLENVLQRSEEAMSTVLESAATGPGTRDASPEKFADKDLQKAQHDTFNDLGKDGLKALENATAVLNGKSPRHSRTQA